MKPRGISSAPLPPIHTTEHSKREGAIQRLLRLLHPDDHRDGLFVGIVKALVLARNQPSSPKQLALYITDGKLATLGGKTPWATVSSRISQHFSRAAKHDPPRSTFLEKMPDSKDFRKFKYCIAEEFWSQINHPQKQSMTVCVQPAHQDVAIHAPEVEAAAHLLMALAESSSPKPQKGRDLSGSASPASSSSGIKRAIDIDSASEIDDVSTVEKPRKRTRTCDGAGGRGVEEDGEAMWTMQMDSTGA